MGVSIRVSRLDTVSTSQSRRRLPSGWSALPESAQRVRRNLTRWLESQHLFVVRTNIFEFAQIFAQLAFFHINEPFSCLHQLAANRVSNQARRRIYVKLAHSGCSMRLRRLYAEIQHRAHALVTVPFCNQFDDRLFSRRKHLVRTFPVVMPFSSPVKEPS